MKSVLLACALALTFMAATVHAVCLNDHDVQANVTVSKRYPNGQVYVYIDMRDQDWPYLADKAYTVYLNGSPQEPVVGGEYGFWLAPDAGTATLWAVDLDQCGNRRWWVRFGQVTNLP